LKILMVATLLIIGAVALENELDSYYFQAFSRVKAAMPVETDVSKEGSFLGQPYSNLNLLWRRRGGESVAFTFTSERMTHG
jgi:hypothetical protein